MPFEQAFADSITYSYVVERSGPCAYVPNIQHRQVSLLGKANKEYEIRQPLSINIEVDSDGTFIVDDDIFLVYGYGDNFREALNDYISSLFEFYKILEVEAESNPFDCNQLKHLQSYIEPNIIRNSDAIQAKID